MPKKGRQKGDRYPRLQSKICKQSKAKSSHILYYSNKEGSYQAISVSVNDRTDNSKKLQVQTISVSVNDVTEHSNESPKNTATSLISFSVNINGGDENSEHIYKSEAANTQTVAA